MPASRRARYQKERFRLRGRARSLGDPSIFSTEGDPVGIQVGTAIATLVRKTEHTRAEQIEFWHLWGQSKPADLIETAEAEPEALYEDVEPILPLGLPFVRTAVSADWFDWPALPDLFPVSFPGVKTSRDGFLVDVDLRRLQARITDYFDAGLSHEEIAARYPSVMKTTARFDARAVRDSLLKRGGPEETGFARFAYRPFDNRWLYWGEGHKTARREARRIPTPSLRRECLDRGTRTRSQGKFLARYSGSTYGRQLRQWAFQLFPCIAPR